MKDRTIFIRNIYYMLAYAFTALRHDGYKNLAGEKFSHIHNLFAAIFCIGISMQLRQGLKRDYLQMQEDLRTVHGRIDLAASLRLKLQHRCQLSCCFDELSENILMNRILKTAALVLLHSSEVERRYKDQLKKSLSFFNTLEPLDPQLVPWKLLQKQHCSRAYLMLLGLSRLLFDGMLQCPHIGKYRLLSFIDEQAMSRLYEKFILAYFTQEHPHIKTAAAQIQWALDDGHAELLPRMQTDVMLTQNSKVLIIDAKYYAHSLQSRYNVRTIHSANLYQIFTYVKNKEWEFSSREHQVSGMLLYAAAEDDFQPNQCYYMSGNKISVRTLDLNRPFNDIAAQLNAIVAEHFGAHPRHNNLLC